MLFKLFLRIFATIATFSVKPVVIASPSLISSSNHYRYFPPAEPDYPPITPFAPSIKLPASSRLNFQEDSTQLFASKPTYDKIYGDKLLVRVSSIRHPDNFNQYSSTNESEQVPDKTAAVSNPASYYLFGSNFDQIKTPSCHLNSCHGPYANDGSLIISKAKQSSDEQCEQIFVTMNGCTSNKGYPVGMVCSVCCQCTKQFIMEMSQSRGFLQGVN
ncbi:unnamed protein product [Thelazia callipaeda]|uniref:DAN domain-containing protein n=1 Tax=Thelazia callipaeda TaxID=103827 RepID=A0A0N5D3I6_THECL|nr:unnamed protein product [Thelazia callipaeda]